MSAMTELEVNFRSEVVLEVTEISEVSRVIEYSPDDSFVVVEVQNVEQLALDSLSDEQTRKALANILDRAEYGVYVNPAEFWDLVEETA